MITTDQPTCFPDELLVRVSSIDDGTMLDRTRGTHVPDIVANRQKFCQEIGVDYDDVVYQKIVYDETQTYDVIREVGVADTTRHTSEVAADALITREKNVALMLPVADCVATVMYDPRQNGKISANKKSMGFISTCKATMPKTAAKLACNLRMFTLRRSTPSPVLTIFPTRQAIQPGDLWWWRRSAKSSFLMTKKQPAPITTGCL